MNGYLPDLIQDANPVHGNIEYGCQGEMCSFAVISLFCFNVIHVTQFSFMLQAIGCALYFIAFRYGIILHIIMFCHPIFRSR